MLTDTANVSNQGISFAYTLLPCGKDAMKANNALVTSEMEVGLAERMIKFCMAKWYSGGCVEVKNKDSLDARI